MSEEQIATIVDAFGGLLALLRKADPLDRAEIYARIGLQMTYRPGTSTVLAEVRSKDIVRGD
jgi:site-specific DNA recombinase